MYVSIYTHLHTYIHTHTRTYMVRNRGLKIVRHFLHFIASSESRSIRRTYTCQFQLNAVVNPAYRSNERTCHRRRCSINTMHVEIDVIREHNSWP